MQKKTISKKILVALSTIGVASIVTPFIYACTQKQENKTNDIGPLDVKPSSQPSKPKEETTNKVNDKPQEEPKDQGSFEPTNPSNPSKETEPTTPSNDKPVANDNQETATKPNETKNENNETELSEPSNRLKTFEAYQPIKNGRKIEIIFEFKKPIPKAVADNTPRSNDPRVSNPVDITKFKVVLNNDQELEFASVRKENAIDTAVLFVPLEFNQLTIKGLKIPDGSIELLKSYQQKHLILLMMLLDQLILV